MAYVTAGHVEDNIGRPLSAAENVQAATWIGWAEATIAARMGSLDRLNADILDMVIIEAVTARLRSPEAVTQVDVTVDDGSISKRYARSSGLIEILPEQWEALGWSGSAGAFSITPYFVAPDVT